MSKRPVVPEAREALNKFKMEMAEDIMGKKHGEVDWGYMSSYHTGQITKKLVESAEKQLANQNRKNFK